MSGYNIKKILYVFFFLEIFFTFTNSEYPDEMLHFISSGSSLFIKVPIYGSSIYKGLKIFTKEVKVLSDYEG